MYRPSLHRGVYLYPSPRHIPTTHIVLKTISLTVSPALILYLFECKSLHEQLTCGSDPLDRGPISLGSTYELSAPFLQVSPCPARFTLGVIANIRFRFLCSTLPPCGMSGMSGTFHESFKWRCTGLVHAHGPQESSTSGADADPLAPLH